MPVTLTQQLLATIGRQQSTSQLVSSGAWASLNPQPIPPHEGATWVSLNPQPIPPREYGALVARELLRLHWQAAKLGLEPALVSSWVEDPCPVGKRPPTPPHLPPIPEPEPGPDWNIEYLLGVASMLAVSFDGSPFISDALEHASRALGESMG